MICVPVSMCAQKKTLSNRQQLASLHWTIRIEMCIRKKCDNTIVTSAWFCIFLAECVCVYLYVCMCVICECTLTQIYTMIDSVTLTLFEKIRMLYKNAIQKAHPNAIQKCVQYSSLFQRKTHVQILGDTKYTNWLVTNHWCCVWVNIACKNCSCRWFEFISTYTFDKSSSLASRVFVILL